MESVVFDPRMTLFSPPSKGEKDEERKVGVTKTRYLHTSKCIASPRQTVLLFISTDCGSL